MLFKALLGRYRIAEDEVRLTAMAPHSEKAVLLIGKVHYIKGFINGDCLAVRLIAGAEQCHGS